MADIFISYSTQDKARIRPLVEALQAEGWTVFWDRTVKAGENWHKVIAQELKASRCVVVAWTKASVESRWVFAEADEGVKRDALIPLNLDAVDIPFGFAHIQSADLTAWDGDPAGAEFHELVVAIVHKIGPVPKKPVATGLAEPPKMAPTAAANTGNEAGPKQANSTSQPVLIENLFPTWLLQKTPPAAPVAIDEKESARQPLETTPTGDAAQEPAALLEIAMPVALQASADYPSPAFSARKPVAVNAPPASKPRPALRRVLAWTGGLGGILAIGIALNTQMDKADKDAPLSRSTVPVTQAQVPTQAVQTPAAAVIEPDMIRIEAGEFQMGGDRYSSEKPAHTVKITQPFAIGRYEVTFEQYDQYARAENKPLPDDQGWGRGKRPIINVSWDDAVAYADWLSKKTGKHYRLPTEAEWEYAARAGTQTQYWWGDAIGTNRASCDGCGSQWDNKQTAPVGSFPANAWGLHDTAGNVWEWVMDGWHENHNGAPTDGQEWVNGADIGRRVVRGGSWFDVSMTLRPALRYGGTATDRINDLGFRLVQDL